MGKISLVWLAIALLLLPIFYVIAGIIYFRSSVKFKDVPIVTLIQSIIQQLLLVGKNK